ncbi:MAG: SH3 domain-containing protein [Clostridia bacterium]|nr:SH3 domain-containing protein [Clostridia bacterium]
MLVLILFLRPVSGWTQSAGSGKALSGTVRVSLSSLGELTEADLIVDGSYTLGDDGETLTRGSSLHVANRSGKLVLTIAGAQRNMGTQFRLRRHNSAGTNGIRLTQARVPGNLYPGDVEFRAKGSFLQVIVHVYIEDYLMGVVPYEMDNSFPLEALKAQAVAARTYTFKKISMQSSVYDVVDTTSDQVYNGTPTGKEVCEQAVRETAGQIGLIDGEYMATFYTASNGGQTESVKNAWGSSNYSYLTVRDDPYDLRNPSSIAKSVSFYRDGTTSVPALTELLKNEAASLLGKSSVVISSIDAVRPSQPKYGAESHVYKKVEVDVTVKGSGALTVILDYFTQVEGICALSINSMQNETLTVTDTVGGFKLTARRFGHGIGLSQHGAQQMGYEGMTSREILDFYYPGLTETTFSFERTLLPSIDGTVMEEEQIPLIDARSASVSLKNPLDVLNLRKSASTAAAILATIPYGTQVTVLGTEGDWSRIQYGTLSGYVKSEYLKEEQENTAEPVSSMRVLVSLSDESQILNLRASPTTTSSVLSYLRSGQELTVIERYSRWTQVKYGSITGYVMNDYIRDPEVSGNAETTEPEMTQAPAATASNQSAIVLPSTGLNLRLSASLRSAVVMVLPQGTILHVRGAASGTMIPVALGNVEGYVSSEYVYVTVLETPGPTAVPTPDVLVLYARVNTPNGLILRSGPAQQANAVRLLDNGTVVRITGEAESGFFPVQTGGESGYVSQDYLTFLTEAEAAGLSLETAGTFAEVTPGPTATPVPPASRVLSGENAYVNAAGGLNLRSEPNSSSSVLAVIGNGVQVVVTGQEQNGFYPVRIGTMTGYLSGSYLVFGEKPAELAATSVPATAAPVQMEPDDERSSVVVRSSNGLNLRAEANTSSQILCVVPNATVLTVLDGEDNGFLHVRWGNTDGYVSEAFVAPVDSE